MQPDTFLRALHAWQGFYTLIGGAAATLTGLVFVAASLGARLINEESDPKVRTFITPTVIYFSHVLLVSLMMNVPTQTRAALTVQLAVVGLGGAGYSLSHLTRLRGFHRDGGLNGQTWLWNFVQPLHGALWLLAGAFGLRVSVAGGLGAAAVGAVLLIMLGIHNSWNMTLSLARLTPS